MHSRSHIRNALLLIGVRLFSQGAGFLLQVLLSRAVSAEALGLYQLTLSLQPVLMSLTAAGFVSACTQLAARSQAVGELSAARRVLRACLRGFLLSFSAVALVTLLLAKPIAARLLGEASVAPAVALLLPLVLLTGIENICKSFFYGIGRVPIPALTELLEPLLRLLAVIGFLRLLSPKGSADAVRPILFGLIACELFSAVTLTLLLPPVKAQLAPKQTTLRASVLAVAFPVGANALLGNLMGAWTSALIPRLLTARGTDAADALSAFGILRGMTLPLLSLPLAVIGALFPLLLPEIARAAALNDRALCRRRLNKAFTAVTLWSFPACALSAVLAPTLGRLIFRQDGAGEHALPFALAIAVGCLEGLLAVALGGIGRQAAASAHALLSGGVQLALTLLFMSLGLGLNGYALAMLFSALLGLWLNARTLSRAMLWRPPLFSALLAPALAATLSALCVKLLLPMLGSLGQLPACGGAVGFGAVVYLSALSAMGALPERRAT